MATLESIKNKIQKLIDSANARTGGSHSDLTSAVDRLSAGYMSGESNDFYRHITFMGEDGETVVDTVSVAPVYNTESSVAPVLTKESTIDKVYTQVGWSLTPGGSREIGVFNNIQHDLTLYPVFQESIRYYTVRFYDKLTLLHTEKVPYNGFSSYTHNKIGARFLGWYPVPTFVTSDLDCYGTWEFASFATDSWDKIAASAENYTAKNLYKTGDEKPITLQYGDGRPDQTIGVRIVHLLDYSESYDKNNINFREIMYEENGRQYTRNAGMILMATMALPDSYMHWNSILKPGQSSMDQNAYTKDGYHDSEISKYLEEEVLPYLPEDLLAVLWPCMIAEWVGNLIFPNDQWCLTGHKLWVPTIYDVCGQARRLYWVEISSTQKAPLTTYGFINSVTYNDGMDYVAQKPFSYMAAGVKSVALTSNDYDNPAECRVITTPDGTPVPWWLGNVENSGHATMVREDGSITTVRAHLEKAYVTFCFCL